MESRLPEQSRRISFLPQLQILAEDSAVGNERTAGDTSIHHPKAVIALTGQHLIDLPLKFEESKILFFLRNEFAIFYIGVSSETHQFLILFDSGCGKSTLPGIAFSKILRLINGLAFLIYINGPVRVDFIKARPNAGSDL